MIPLKRVIETQSVTGGVHNSVLAVLIWGLELVIR